MSEQPNWIARFVIFLKNRIDITQIITNFAVDFIQYYKFHYSLYKEGGLDYKLDLFI